MHNESRSIQEDIGYTGQEGQGPDPAQGDDMIQEPQGKTWLDWILTRTGPGGVEDYVSHPLHWENYYKTGNLGLARVIRGVTGLLGDLDLAVIDIGLGILEYIRPAAEPDRDGLEGGSDNGEGGQA